jgi:hypothetical protein
MSVIPTMKAPVKFAFTNVDPENHALASWAWEKLAFERSMLV